MTDPMLEYAPQPMTAAQAEAADRLTFIRKTYSLVLLGIAIFVAFMLGAEEVPAIQSIAKALYGTGWLLILIWLGSAFLVRMLARTPVFGMVAYLAYAAFLGIMIAPLFMYAKIQGTAGPAAIITLAVFGGLTGYVFVTKKDFSWMGGALAIGLFGMIGVAIAGLIFGFHVGVWYSILGALLFSGYILYDTSNILHRHSTDKPLPAAIELFVDIVMLFWFILDLMSDR